MAHALAGGVVASPDTGLTQPKSRLFPGIVVSRLRKGTKAVLETLAEALKLFAEGFVNARGEVKNALVHGVVYLAFFVVIFFGSFMIRTESVIEGMKLGYSHSWLSPMQGYTQVHSQRELSAGVHADSIMSRLLIQVLHIAPHSARSQLALIHNGVMTITGVELLRFDIVATEAAPGRSGGDLQSNLPLAEWSPDYMPALLRHECLLQHTSEITNAARHERLAAMGTAAVLGCPVIDVNDQIFGSIIVQWDEESEVPNAQQLADITAKVKSYGAEIGAALDIQRAAN